MHNHVRIGILFCASLIMFPVATCDQTYRLDELGKHDGRWTEVDGVAGTAMRLDGFTSCRRIPAEEAPPFEKGLSIEAWIAPAAYPWNWCPIVTQRHEETSGFFFGLGPRGELSLQLAFAGEWQVCTSGDFAVPLRQWTHVAGTYDGENGLAVYLNGARAAAAAAPGVADLAPDAELRIGMDYEQRKPSHIHREHGTLPGWYSFDGILDEVKLHDHALTPDEVGLAYTLVQPDVEPDLPVRRLPSGPPGPGRFGAVYTRLDYYPEWDDLWAVGPDPDVLVRFDQSAARVVFWRGSRYSPAWVSENGLWMADQSVEAWGVGEADTEGCFEHMQDRRCRYSHVRIIESHDARVVVHWRYAPVSSHDHLWRVDEKTGRACWVDEYYYLYPDAMGVRKVTWKTGTLGHPRQFQESLPFTHPGQMKSDVVELDFAVVGNLVGESQVMSFVEDPRGSTKSFPDDLTIQMYNFKARNRPFIVYEPGSGMEYVRDFSIRGYDGPGACNHWPVGQALCDGRTVQAADRPTHFLGFPITYPPVHEEGGRSWWNGLYGMTTEPFDEVVVLARSWCHPPDLTVDHAGSALFDRSERAYVIDCDNAAGIESLTCSIAASPESPLVNIPVVIRGWGDAGITLEMDGRMVERGRDFRFGFRHHVNSVDLIVWIRRDATEPVSLKLSRVAG